MCRRYGVKPFDIPIVSGMFLLTLIPCAIWYHQQYSSTTTSSKIYAVVKVHQQIIRTIDLTDNHKHYEFRVTPGKNQYNVIEVDGKRIRDQEDNSHDQIAVHTGWIQHPGEQSICLPHQLLIEIKGTRTTDDDNTGLVTP